MNKAKLITASGHAWSSVGYGIDRVSMMYLGKRVEVKTPGGYTMEIVKAVEIYNANAMMIGMRELSEPAIRRMMGQREEDSRTRDDILAENVKLKERVAELEKDYGLLCDAKDNLEQDYCSLLEDK